MYQNSRESIDTSIGCYYQIFRKHVDSVLDFININNVAVAG